jgi:predicted phage tail protein
MQDSGVGEWQVSVSVILVALAWASGWGLIGAACMGLVSPPFAVLGMSVITAGCMRTIACWFRRQERREVEAFELGRQSMRIVNR